MKKTAVILLIIFTSVFGVMDTYALDTLSNNRVVKVSDTSGKNLASVSDLPLTTRLLLYNLMSEPTASPTPSTPEPMPTPTATAKPLFPDAAEAAGTIIQISDTRKIVANVFNDENGNIMVPAKKLVNAIGGSVYYDENSGTIGIVYYDTYIGLSVNNDAVTVGRLENGEIVGSIDMNNANIAKSQIIDGEIYVPLTALGMALGLRENLDYGYNDIENEIYFLNYWYDPVKVPYLSVAELTASAYGTMFKTMGKIVAETNNDSTAYYLEGIEGDGARIELTNITTADNKYWENQIGAPNNDPNGMEVVITSALVEKDGAAAISLSRSISSILPINIESKITEPYITIKIDGEVLDTTGSDPFMGIDANGDYRTYIPFRVIAQALGFAETTSKNADFVNGNKNLFIYENIDGIDTVTLYYDGKLYSFKSGVAGYYTQDKTGGSQEYIDTINGESIPAPIIRDDRMFLPVRAFATVFGCNVDWEEATKTVLITSN